MKHPFTRSSARGLAPVAPRNRRGQPLGDEGQAQAAGQADSGTPHGPDIGSRNLELVAVIPERPPIDRIFTPLRPDMQPAPKRRADGAGAGFHGARPALADLRRPVACDDASGATTATSAANAIAGIERSATAQVVVNREPVSMEKAGRIDTVILSAEQCQALQAHHDKPSRVARNERWKPSSVTGSQPRTPTLRSTAFPEPTCVRGEWLMAQYDVFANPGSSPDDGVPCVIVIHSDLLDALAARLTLPLAVLDVATRVLTSLCPVIVIQGQLRHALAYYAAPLPAKLLRRPMDNVAALARALLSRGVGVGPA